MERTQIYLSEEEIETLDRLAEASGRSKSQLIRDAIDRVYVRGGGKGLLKALDESFGSWRGRRETGAEYVERVRHGRLARLHERR